MASSFAVPYRERPRPARWRQEAHLIALACGSRRRGVGAGWDTPAPGGIAWSNAASRKTVSHETSVDAQQNELKPWWSDCE